MINLGDSMKKISFLFFLVFFLYSCQGDDLKITSVERVEDRSVLVLTPFENLDLPEEVTVRLSNNEEITVTVRWEEVVFDTPKTYQVVGVVIEEDQDKLPETLNLTVNVNVMPYALLDLLKSDPNLSIFNTLIEETNLNTILELEGPFTVFAPSNEAFSTWFELLNTDLDTFLDNDDLDEFVLYYLLNGNFSTNALVATVPGEIMTLSGDTINVSLSGAKIQLNQSSVINQTFVASNGRLHEIDQLLISQDQLESVFDDFFDDELISFFFSLFQEGELPIDLFLEGSLTIFLPSEEAWLEYIDLQESSIEDLVTSEGFIDLLTYHLFVGTYTAESLFNDAPINIRNIQGDLLRVDVVEGNLTIRGAKIISTESFGDVALIHFIDQVLVPNEE